MGWATIFGNFDFDDDHRAVFLGSESSEGGVGTAISSCALFRGEVSATVEFEAIDSNSACQLVVYWEPLTGALATAGLSNETSYVVATYTGAWHPYLLRGTPNAIVAGRKYDLSARREGSRILLSVDGVRVGDVTLPVSLQRAQVGVWCKNSAPIRISNFTVSSESPRAFAVMQFSPPFNEIYECVIKPTCDQADLVIKRADETFGAGLVLADIVADIQESAVVIADITPSNPNVYYELGYAHALHKPVILLANREIGRLPFDVSPFRTVFYDNSIAGKDKLQQELLAHLKAVLSDSKLGGA